LFCASGNSDAMPTGFRHVPGNDAGISKPN
jgi:hypothetical protein